MLQPSYHLKLAIVYAQNFLSPTLASLLITTSPAVAAVLERMAGLRDD